MTRDRIKDIHTIKKESAENGIIDNTYVGIVHFRYYALRDNEICIQKEFHYYDGTTITQLPFSVGVESSITVKHVVREEVDGELAIITSDEEILIDFNGDINIDGEVVNDTGVYANGVKVSDSILHFIVKTKRIPEGNIANIIKAMTL